MQLIDLTLPTPKRNLAFDEACLQRLGETDGAAHTEPEALRFWESPTLAVVLVRGGDVATEVHEEACVSEKIPILRRASGGGAVVLGPGCLNFCLALSLSRRPELLDVRRSYEIILDTLIHAQGGHGVKFSGQTDLVLADRKVSGNAQKRTRRALLHQGTVLYNFDIDILGRLLKEPATQPAYRRGRCHREFVGNVRIRVDEFKVRLSEIWKATHHQSMYR
jgi:lipoate-protein ligase A